MNPIMNSVEAFESELAHRDVSSAYRGRLGCACGCNGDHTSDSVTVNRILKQMRSAIETGRAREIMVLPRRFVSIETASRLYIAYTDGRTS